MDRKANPRTVEGEVTFSFSSTMVSADLDDDDWHKSQQGSIDSPQDARFSELLICRATDNSFSLVQPVDTDRGPVLLRTAGGTKHINPSCYLNVLPRDN